MQYDCHHNGQVYHKAVAEEQLARQAQAGKGRDCGPVGCAGGGHGDLAHAAGHGVQAAAEEVGHAAAEDGQRQAGDILIGPGG